MNIYTVILLYVALYIVLCGWAKKKEIEKNDGSDNANEDEDDVFRGRNIGHEGLAMYHESRGDMEQALHHRTLSN